MENPQEITYHNTLQTIKLQQGLLPSHTNTLFMPVPLLPSPHPGHTLSSLASSSAALPSLAAQPLPRTSHSCALPTSANPPPLKPAHSCMLSVLSNPASFLYILEQIIGYGQSLEGFTDWLEKHLQGVIQEYVILPYCRETDQVIF